MRPIDKGPCPQVNGTDKTVRDYKDWRRDLIARTGYYCAYCNMSLSHQLHVEHVTPKKPQSGHPAGNWLAWENMLLACEKCNLAKSNKPSDASIHYLPEYHNALLVFEALPDRLHTSAMIVAPKSGLNVSQQTKAQQTIDDFEWQNIDTRGAVVDIRWMKRSDTQIQVNAARNLLEITKVSPTYNADFAGKCVATMATGTGFFLLWFQEFANEPAVLKWLIDPALFPGVAQSCFDPVTFQPVPRNPGDISDPT
jgi:hypothetical protein